MGQLTLQDDWEDLTPNERRNKLMQFHETCAEQEQVEIPLTEYFCEGVYARQIDAPKGTALVGEIHKYPNLNTLAKGKIKVATEEGVKILEAPCTFISPAGTKRVGYVLEDATWITYHATKHTNGEDVRKEIIAPDYASLDKHLEYKKDVIHSDSSIGGDKSTSIEREQKSSGKSKRRCFRRRAKSKKGRSIR